jgi:hypothetical protein
MKEGKGEEACLFAFCIRGLPLYLPTYLLPIHLSTCLASIISRIWSLSLSFLVSCFSFMSSREGEGVEGKERRDKDWVKERKEKEKLEIK